MYKRVLVPVDGSKLAELAFTYAEELAGSLDLDVTLIHIADPAEEESLPMHKEYVEHAAEIVERGIKKVQKSMGAPASKDGVQVVSEVAVGYPAEEILRYADHKKFDLVLMSTHGWSGIRRWVMGSVADKVLRASRIPVLLLRADLPQEAGDHKWPTTIIVPLDGSKLAESVLPHVETLAKRSIGTPMDVVLIRVCEPPTTPGIMDPALPFDWQKLMDEHWAQCKKSSQEYLSSMEKQLDKAGLKVRSEMIEQLKAHPADEIIDYAGKNPSSLIAMATCGRSGIGRLAYGSVAQKVLFGASNPVLLVRPGSNGSPLRC